jgi:RNA polymerase sigma-70 factor (ECF subfamily)
MSTAAITLPGLRLRSASCAPSEEREAHRLPPPDADALLLERIARGDQDAVAELYDRHARRAYGLALRVTADPTLAEDAVQEAFCAIWRRADSFRASRGSATSWVLALVHHKAVDAVRREQARRRPLRPEQLERPEPVTPEQQVLASDEGQRARVALARLPEQQQRLLGLLYLDGLTQREVADLLAVPLGTVKSRTHVAMGTLRRALHAVG